MLELCFGRGMNGNGKADERNVGNVVSCGK